MTREIKFQAFVKNTKQMINVKIINFIDQRISDGLLNFSFEEVELMQSTGLKDKNGKEIYEGDIIRIEDDQDNVYWEAEVRYIGAGYVAVELEDPNGQCWFDENHCEVIGNIYEVKNK